ncbi:MAG TPA: AAA family ATPase [Candidatus Saccharibacteria bacterium]|nr:AAA family ATPase [Candidatus Saccharibacteria bacterium]HRK94109.1 AAA family ATPase [Candidatus Saccharibacteria bacterium]
MGTRLIILRGNSASGKTTIAQRLQKELGRGTALISQDVVRREILRVKDTANNPSREMIEQMVRTAWELGFTVILEGILSKKRYGDIVNRLVRDCPGGVLSYYFDIPFAETLRRHSTKSVASDYGEKEMRNWWNAKDYLGITGEETITVRHSVDEIIHMILSDVKRHM